MVDTHTLSVRNIEMPKWRPDPKVDGSRSRTDCGVASRSVGRGAERPNWCPRLPTMTSPHACARHNGAHLRGGGLVREHRDGACGTPTPPVASMGQICVGWGLIVAGRRRPHASIYPTRKVQPNWAVMRPNPLLPLPLTHTHTLPSSIPRFRRCHQRAQRYNIHMHHAVSTDVHNATLVAHMHIWTRLP